MDLLVGGGLVTRSRDLVLGGAGLEVVRLALDH